VRSIGIFDYSIFSVVLSSEISNPGNMLCLVMSIEPSSYSSSLDLIYLVMIVQSTFSPCKIGCFFDLTWRSFGLADFSNCSNLSRNTVSFLSSARPFSSFTCCSYLLHTSSIIGARMGETSLLLFGLFSLASNVNMFLVGVVPATLLLSRLMTGVFESAAPKAGTRFSFSSLF